MRIYKIATLGIIALLLNTFPYVISIFLYFSKLIPVVMVKMIAELL